MIGTVEAVGAGELKDMTLAAKRPLVWWDGKVNIWNYKTMEISAGRDVYIKCYKYLQEGKTISARGI